MQLPPVATRRRGRSDTAGHALRDRRTQPEDRMGIYKRWSDCHRSLHRELQCGRVISDTEGLGAAGASNRDDSREGQAGYHGGREGHTAWTDHHGAGTWRVTATGTALDTV